MLSQAAKAWKRQEYQSKRDKILAARKEAHRKNPEKYLAVNRARKRGCENGDPPHIGICPICELQTMLYYDHDHRTNKFRGWICSGCNRGLGAFRDDPQALRTAAYYVICKGFNKPLGEWSLRLRTFQGKRSSVPRPRRENVTKAKQCQAA